MKLLPASPHARADLVREPFFKEAFVLKSAPSVKLEPWSFGFGEWSEVVFRDHYARGEEEWPDAVVRVVEGVFSIRKSWHKVHGLRWDDGYWQGVAEEMALAFLKLECGPPGRGYARMGTDYVRMRGAMALINCAATEVTPTTIGRDLEWALDVLGSGSGVGFGIRRAENPFREPEGEPCVYMVPDTREGWAESVRLLVESYLGAMGKVAFGYDEIRPRGAPMVSLGATSTGADPLRLLHLRMRETLSRAARREISWTRCAADLCNQIGVSIQSGPRQSAEILLGDPEDEEFLDLKDLTKNPDREEWYWASNNSPRLERREHFPLIATQIAPRAAINGEPGFVNMVAVKKFARFGREKADKATLFNPCQPGWATVLTPEGEEQINDVGVGSTIWSGQRWTKITAKVHTGLKPVRAYATLNGTFFGTGNHVVIQDGARTPAELAARIDPCPMPYEAPWRASASSREITSRTYIGEFDVYDITVEAEEHTYWTGGLLVSNCGEIPLENKEICNVSEVYPSRCYSPEKLLRAAELSCLYASTVALLPTHLHETNAVVARNRRIGVSMSGVSDWQARQPDVTRNLRMAYDAARSMNEALAVQAGVPASCRVTTVKPGGTVPQLAGVSGGCGPAQGKYYVRRKRVLKSSPHAARLALAGFPREECLTAPDSWVYEFPVAQPGTKTSREAGMHEQALQVAMMQREWADNAVSCTVEFSREEAPKLPTLMAQMAPMVKSMAVLPRDHGYAQAPYEEISEEEFTRRCAATRPIDWSSHVGEGRAKPDDFCSSGSCEVRRGN